MPAIITIAKNIAGVFEVLYCLSVLPWLFLFMINFVVLEIKV